MRRGSVRAAASPSSIALRAASPARYRAPARSDSSPASRCAQPRALDRRRSTLVGSSIQRDASAAQEIAQRLAPACRAAAARSRRGRRYSVAGAMPASPRPPSCRAPGASHGLDLVVERMAGQHQVGAFRTPRPRPAAGSAPRVPRREGRSRVSRRPAQGAMRDAVAGAKRGDVARLRGRFRAAARGRRSRRRAASPARTGRDSLSGGRAARASRCRRRRRRRPRVRAGKVEWSKKCRSNVSMPQPARCSARGQRLFLLDALLQRSRRSRDSACRFP